MNTGMDQKLYIDFITEKFIDNAFIIDVVIANNTRTCFKFNRITYIANHCTSIEYYSENDQRYKKIDGDFCIIFKKNKLSVICNKQQLV